MKYLLAILILCSTVSASVRNTGSTRRDSVGMYVVCLDSTGKLSTCDSFYVRVMNNSSNAVLFSDSGTLAMTGMDSISGKSEYYYHRLVADIDGGGTDGEYILSVLAKKTAGSGWGTPNTRIFEIQNNIVADSLVLKRMGVYNTTDNAVEWTSTANSKGAFVLSATGTGTLLGSAFRMYSKYGSGLVGIAGSLHSDNLAAGITGMDSSTAGYGIFGRGIASGYGIGSYEDAGATLSTALTIGAGPVAGIGTEGITAGSIQADAIGSSELADAAAREIASHILKDTTKRIGVKGGLGDSVLTPTPSVSATVSTLPDSVQSNIARHVWDRTADTTYPNKSWGDTVGKTALNVTTYLGSAPLKPGDTDELRANIAAAIGTPLKPSDTDELRANIIAAMTTPLKPSDTDELRANIVAALPTLKQIRDTIIRAADTARIHVNDSGHVLIDDQWTDAQRDSIVARVLAARDSLHLRPINTFLVTDSDDLRASIIAAIPVEWTGAQRDSIIARVLANRDTAHSIHLAVDTVRDTANADVALDRLQATAANLIKVIDSVNAILDTLQNVNSALRVDTATGGGGGGGEVWTSAEKDSIIARVVKLRDSVQGILDTLQNLSSTLRLAGSDIDTVYQTVLCSDTIGGDFLLTLSDYRAQVKRKFGVEISNTTWMTDTVLNQLIREAIVTVNPIMRGYKTTKVMVSHFDSSDYPLDSLVGIASVLWHKDDTARSIPYLAREKWATLATQNTYGGDDPYLERPQVYDYTDALISFFPVPTSADTIQINGWAKIPNITVVSSVAQIPQKYRIAILKYVTFLVARAKQHPLIQTYLDEYHESIMFLMERQNVKADSK